jgi:hypothetical protein
VAGLWRDATTASLPGVGGTDQDTRKWLTAWEGKDDQIGIKGPPYRVLGVDAKWENCLVVADANGNIIETWPQWDKLMRGRTGLHSPAIPSGTDRRRQHAGDSSSPTTANAQQTIGTPEREGADAILAGRPSLAARRVARLDGWHRTRGGIRQDGSS